MAVFPTVIYPLTLPALLDHILVTQSISCPTTLIVCSTRETFLQDSLHALQSGQEADALQQLLAPTLRNLLTTRHVKIVFCESVQSLLAYLTAYDGASPKGEKVNREEARERIVLVDPLGLHAPTPSFSAQGLSRVFAAAAEMSWRLGASLVVAECRKNWREEGQDEEEDWNISHEDQVSPTGVDESPWEQEVSILNVSAKKFGSGNADRAWAGRTVKIKRIAARWFRFHELDHHISKQTIPGWPLAKTD